MENEMRFAGVWRRIVASMVDSFVTRIISGVLVFAYLFEAQETIISYSNEGRLVAAFGLFVGVTMVVSVLVAVLYDVISWTRFEGKTVGYKLLGVQLVQVDGGPVTVRTALLRIVGSVLAALPLGLGYLWILWDKKKQGWHDKIAGTYVLERGPARAGLVILAIVLYFVFGAIAESFMKLPALEEVFEENMLREPMEAWVDEEFPPFEPVVETETVAETL
jgi:uncharacterized RDD family membrane protein YckC